jgi:hypothetical protein
MDNSSWTLKHTEERFLLISRLREKLAASGRPVGRVHGIVSTASVFDEALKALERELDAEQRNNGAG